MSYDELLRSAQGARAARPLVDDEIAKGRAEDTAALFYTSGTTGSRGRGADVSRVDRPLAGVLAAGELDAGRGRAWYLPMAWNRQNIFSYAQAS